VVTECGSDLGIWFGFGWWGTGRAPTGINSWPEPSWGGALCVEGLSIRAPVSLPPGGVGLSVVVDIVGQLEDV